MTAAIRSHGTWYRWWKVDLSSFKYQFFKTSDSRCLDEKLQPLVNSTPWCIAQLRMKNACQTLVKPNLQSKTTHCTLRRPAATSLLFRTFHGLGRRTQNMK